MLWRFSAKRVQDVGPSCSGSEEADTEAAARQKFADRKGPEWEIIWIKPFDDTTTPDYTLPLTESNTMADDLSPDQAAVIEAVQAGENVFITGPGGVGKSFLLKRLRDMFPDMAATATTGVAAVNIEGRTIHAWSGLWGDKVSVTDLAFEMISESKPWHHGQLKRIRQCKKLCLDETSMSDADYVDNLDSLFRMVRECNEPFGGIQMLFVGDFLQLPPVCRSASPSFAFESDYWHTTPPKLCPLTTMFRQDDRAFVDVLASIRMGEDNAAIWELLPPRINADLGAQIVALFSHNSDADDYNQGRLRELSGESTVYKAEATGSDSVKKTFQKNCNAPETLALKIGASVLLVKNLDTEGGFVNGSQGIVTGLKPGSVQVAFPNGRVWLEPETWKAEEGSRLIGSWTQIPLRLGWGLTIHKAQGMSLGAVSVDLSRCFTGGQAYVALSRAESLGGLSIVDRIEAKALRPNPKAKEFYLNQT